MRSSTRHWLATAQLLLVAAAVAIIPHRAALAAPSLPAGLQGSWRGEFDVQGQPLPFNFEITAGDLEKARLVLVNAPRREAFRIEHRGGADYVVAFRNHDTELPQWHQASTYLPGPHAGIFNPESLNESEVILCEALLDALTFMAAGFINVTSIYGTEGFTDELFEALKRRKVQRVKLAYDADEAGERAAARDAERLRAVGIEVYRIKFPWGMDADEYARKVTPAAQSLRLLIHGAAWLGGGAVPVVESKTEACSPVAPACSSLVAASY